MIENRYDLVNKEILDITTKPIEYKELKHEIIFRNKISIIPIRIFESIENLADYNNNVMDHLTLNVFLSSGVYSKDVFEHKDNIEVTINTSRDDKLYSSITYKAILVDVDNNMSGIVANISKEELDMSGMVRVTFQLIEQELELIRIVKTSGIYKDMDVSSIMTTIFYNTINKIKIKGTNIIPTINIVKPDNTNKYKHVIIPTGTRLVDLPTYLHDTDYGIYKGDIGLYFKTKVESVNKNNLNVYVYPLYSIEKNKYKELVIYYANTQFSKVNDNNYYNTDEMLKVVASDLDIAEIKQNTIMNKGGAITGNDPDTLLSYSNTVTNDKLTYNKKIDNTTLNQKDGLTNERYVGNEVNLFKHVSRVMSDSMDLVKVTWNYSNSSLLIPGMHVTIYYPKDNKVKKMVGVLQQYHMLYREINKIETTTLLLKMKDVE